MSGRRVAALVAAVLTAGSAMAAPAHAGVAVVTVTKAGDTSFRVPGSVTSLAVRATGAAGGAGGGAGGRGAVVAGTIAVTPGSVLTAFVGAGAGTSGSSAASLRGGNGGGASGLSLAGAALLIAGGGGGGGGGVFGGPGGDAGAGGGAGKSTVAAQNAGGGGAGTSDAGAGGTQPADGDGVAGQSGVAGAGGNGADGAGSGGGGGGGYRGGGGGGASATGGAGGGGGGSNFSAGATAVTVDTSTSTPHVQLTYTDEQAPTLTLAAPTGTITGFAGTDSGDAPSVTLEFYEGALAIGSPVTTSSVGKGPDGAFSSAMPFLGDGTWTVRAVQADIAGNVGVSESRSITIDRTAPRIQLTSPDGATADAIPHFEGTIGTAAGDLTTVTLTLTAPGGATVTFPGTAVKGGSFSAEAPAALPDGTYTVVASQEDEAGHVGRSTLTFVIDTVAPVVTLTGPEAETSSATITGVAGTAVGDDATVLLQVRPSSGAAIQVSAPVVAGTFAASMALADGVYTVTAIQTDRAANAGIVTRTFRVTNPAPPPGVVAATPTPTPRPAIKKAAGLQVKSATASRRGRTTTLKLRGTAARTATGTVTVATGGKRATAKLVKGAWTATLRITGAPRKSLKVTVAYGGDSGFNAATAKRTVRVR